MAWYLGLQRLLNLPKYFIAPIKRSPLHGRSEIDCPEISDFTNNHFTENRDGFERKNRASMPFMPVSNRIAPPGQISLLNSIPKFAKNPSFRIHNDWHSAHTLDPKLVYKKFAQSAVAQFNGGRLQLPESPLQSKLHLQAIVSLPTNTRPETLISLAPGAIKSVQDTSADQRYRPARGAPAVETNQIFRAPQSITTSFRKLANKASLGGQDFLATDSDTETGHDATQRTGPLASTLHIDGSALGRWAVQYLERALGKPVTGMTGVDPRASVPRYRVSPF